MPSHDELVQTGKLLIIIGYIESGMYDEDFESGIRINKKNQDKNKRKTKRECFPYPLLKFTEEIKRDVFAINTSKLPAKILHIVPKQSQAWLIHSDIVKLDWVFSRQKY